jgi:hypothetical protein
MVNREKSCDVTGDPKSTPAIFIPTLPPINEPGSKPIIAKRVIPAPAPTYAAVFAIPSDFMVPPPFSSLLREIQTLSLVDLLFSRKLEKYNLDSAHYWLQMQLMILILVMSTAERVPITGTIPWNWKTPSLFLHTIFLKEL